MLWSCDLHYKNLFLTFYVNGAHSAGKISNAILVLKAYSIIDSHGLGKFYRLFSMRTLLTIMEYEYYLHIISFTLVITFKFIDYVNGANFGIFVNHGISVLSLEYSFTLITWHPSLSIMVMGPISSTFISTVNYDTARVRDRFRAFTNVGLEADLNLWAARVRSQVQVFIH